MNRLPQPFQDEMKGISAATGIELGNAYKFILSRIYIAFFVKVLISKWNAQVITCQICLR